MGSPLHIDFGKGVAILNGHFDSERSSETPPQGGVVFYSTSWYIFCKRS